MKVRLMVLSGILTASALSINAQEKPKVNVGTLVHTYVSAQQRGFGSTSAADDASSWDLGANLYRARVLLDVQLSERDYVFVETELSAAVGMGANKASSIKILDAQYEHKFADWLSVSAGKMLVSHNRNGLQTAGTLMANDFTYFQYPYNMSENDALQGDLGRDVGINFLGGFLENKLKYRAGLFSGRRTFEGEAGKPLRFTGRLEYNFADIDAYSGTNLGEGKTVTLAGGVDAQGTYVAAGADLYVDYPLGSKGSLTANLAYSYLNGGNDPTAKYSFAHLIPEQDILFAELGYYFKKCRLQPWVKYEKQNTHEAATTTTVYGGGLNYFFSGYKTNLRLSYASMEKGVLTSAGTIDKKAYGQVWMQLQLFFF